MQNERTKKSTSILNTLAVAFALAVALFLAATVVARPGSAHGAYGYPPNLGTFAENSVKCTGELGATQTDNKIRFSGAWHGMQDGVFQVYTWERGYVPFTSKQLSISIDGQRQTTPGYAVIPSWDGIVGHEPVINVTLSGVPAEKEFYFFLKWAAAPADQIALLVSAWANEPVCLITD